MTPLTSNLVAQFYTPQKSPDFLIFWSNLFSAASVLLSLVWGPLAAGAAAGTVISGILTVAGLDAVNPLVQWSEVDAALGGLYTQLTDAIETYYDFTLEQLPVPIAGGTTYETNATELPSIFMDGEFASQTVVTNVPVLTQTGIYASFASSGINSLWVQDHVFIIKISDSTYGKGAGAACNAFPNMTVCVDGVAFIFARWVWTTMTPIDETSEIDNYLQAKTWQVWGAYADGSANGNANADQLTQYNLNLPEILASVQKTLAINTTFPFTN